MFKWMSLCLVVAPLSVGACSSTKDTDTTVTDTQSSTVTHTYTDTDTYTGTQQPLDPNPLTGQAVVSRSPLKHRLFLSP
jgi:hypothetical protein